MSKLVKRTLAFALVICMLLGTMVMPTFAVVEDADPIVYDFTALSQKVTAANGAQLMWAYTSGATFYGFGNVNMASNPNINNWMNHWYTKGTHTVNEVEYAKDLNWKLIATKGNDDGTNNDSLLVGGYFSDNEANKHAYDGLVYTYKPSNKASCGGWIAMQVKFPGIGTYNVDLGYYESQFGTCQGSIYILPGAVTDRATINAAVANGTGKLDGSVNMYKKGTVAGLGSESGRPYTGGLTADFGNVTIDQVCDYTVIFTNDLVRDGSSGAGEARFNLEKLTLTLVDDEESSGAGAAVNYDFDRDTSSGLISAASSTVGMYTNGTDSAYAEDGTTVTGYEINNGNRYFAASKSKFLSGSSTAIVNYALLNALEAKYTSNALNWQLLGTNVDSEYSFMSQSLQVNSFSNTEKCVAILLRSPGAGQYALTANTYVNTASSGTEKELTSHLWLDAKLVKLTGDMTADNFVEYIDEAQLVGSYKPAYQANAAVCYVDAPLLTYTFEEGAQYILYLSRSADADNSTADGNNTYSSNNIFLNHIDAEPVPETKATIGDTQYATLTAAAAEAEANDVIVLQKDVAVASVSIPANVTLDLNGKMLSTNAFSTAGGCKIIDSANGAGKLNVPASEANFTGEDPLAANVLPLYDAANNSYRFYAYTFGNGVVKADSDVEGAVRFWFQLTFADDAAYDLIATGKSGLTIGVSVTNNDITTPCIFANNVEEEITNNAAAWAAAYGAFAKDANDPWLWVRVQNIAAASNLSVTPVITAGNTDFTASPIAYTAG